MGYSLDANGHLDLSPCFHSFCYDYFKLESLSKEYFYAELCDLVAWDGTPIIGMREPKERPWRHLACKHNHDRGPINQIMDLDPTRIARFPVLKDVVMGLRAIDVYEQAGHGRGPDKIEIVARGIDRAYLVALGVVRGGYRIRSAYPAGEKYVERIEKRTGSLVERIRPRKIP